MKYILQIMMTVEEESWSDYFGKHKVGTILLVFFSINVTGSMINSTILSGLAWIVAIVMYLTWKPKPKKEPETSENKPVVD